MRMHKNIRESSKPRPPAARGFTLLELMIVMAIIMILTGIAVGRYEQSLRHSHEVALRQDLYVMRGAIQSYAEDKGSWPSSLDDLKTAKYIGAVPKDPITGQANWTTETDDCDVLSVDQTSSDGICGVNSSAEGTGMDGTAYSTW
jgi:general secretion pathway protein G